MSDYYGISYPRVLQWNWVYPIWRRVMCPRGNHLLDEVGSIQHYLVCDACQLMVVIDHIDDRYVGWNEQAEGDEALCGQDECDCPCGLQDGCKCGEDL